MQKKFFSKKNSEKSGAKKGIKLATYICITFQNLWGLTDEKKAKICSMDNQNGQREDGKGTGEGECLRPLWASGCLRLLRRESSYPSCSASTIGVGTFFQRGHSDRKWKRREVTKKWTKKRERRRLEGEISEKNGR